MSTSTQKKKQTPPPVKHHIPSSTPRQRLTPTDPQLRAVKPGEDNADLERALQALEIKDQAAAECNYGWLYFPMVAELSLPEAAGSGPEGEGDDDDEAMNEG